MAIVETTNKCSACGCSTWDIWQEKSTCTECGNVEWHGYRIYTGKPLEGTVPLNTLQPGACFTHPGERTICTVLEAAQDRVVFMRDKKRTFLNRKALEAPVYPVPAAMDPQHLLSAEDLLLREVMRNSAWEILGQVS